MYTLYHVVHTISVIATIVMFGFFAAGFYIQGSTMIEYGQCYSAACNKKLAIAYKMYLYGVTLGIIIIPFAILSIDLNTPSVP
jgi:hypothetical protein